MDNQLQEVKKLISSILISCPLQMTIRKVDADYADQIGERIPYKKFGFDSLETFLRSMPDILDVRGSGLNAEVHVQVSSKTAHIDKLISQQRIAAPKAQRFGSRPRRRSRRRSPQFSGFPRTSSPSSQFLTFSTPVTHTYNNRPVPKYVPKSLNCAPQSIFQTTPNISLLSGQNLKKSPTSKLPEKYTPIRDTKKPIEKSIIAPIPTTSHKMHVFENNSKLSTVIGNTINNRSDCSSGSGAIPKINNPLNVSPLLHSESSEDIYYSDSDWEEQFGKQSPEIVQNSSKNVRDDNFYGHYVGNIPENAKDSQADVCPSSNDSNVPLSVQKNLKKLISQYDDGIWCGRLPNIYKKMFGKELDFMEYKYKSLITMCLDLSDIFQWTRPDTGDFKLYDRQKPLPKDCFMNFKISEFVKASAMTTTTPSTEPALNDIKDILNREDLRMYPEDVLRLSDVIPRQFLPHGVKEDDFIDVYVGEVFDPSKFWILLNSYAEDLNSVMDDMQIFYSKCDGNLKIPDNMLQVGLYCAAIYNKEYHRAIIVSDLNLATNRIKVFYIDYGSVCTITTESIHYLHRQFSKLPQQAIRARLACIYPPVQNTAWSVDASTRLLHLVSMKILVAHVYRIDWERQSVEIFLADTTGEEDIYMNDTLVHEGYAIFTHKEQTPAGKLQAVPVVKHIHLFPTFKEIEQGRTPNSAEIVRLTKLGVSPDVLYPHYFKSNYDISEIDAIISNEDQNLKEHEIRRSTLVESFQKCLTVKEVEEKSLAANSRSRIINNYQSEIELNDTGNIDLTSPSSPKENWTDTFEEQYNDSIEICEETSLLNSEITQTQVEKNVLPPPGFDKVQIAKDRVLSSTPINFNNVQSQIVTPTTTVGATNSDQLILNYLLSQQQNTLLNSYIPPQTHPVTFFPPPVSTVINYPVNYLPLTQQMLLLQNQRPAFSFQNQYHQPNRINFMQSSPPDAVEQIMLEQKLRSQMWRNSYINQFQNLSDYRNNLLYKNTDSSSVKQDAEQKQRDVLKQLICCQLASGNDKTVEHLQHILERQQCAAENGHMYRLLSVMIANKSLGIPNTNLQNVYNEVLKLLSDKEIIELAEKVTETSKNDDNTSNQMTNKNHDLNNVPSSINKEVLTNCQFSKFVSSGTEEVQEVNHIENSNSWEVNSKNDFHEKYVMKTDLNKKPVHVIRINSKTYVIANEIMQFTASKAPIEKIRKLMVLVDPSNPVMDLSLNDYKEVAQELSRFKNFDSNEVLHMIPVELIPNIIEILGSKETGIDYVNFAKRIDVNGDLWLNT